MDSQIEEIKNKLNILDIVSDYVKLSKTGVNYRGICPFHLEKSPSFFVNPVRQIWHCFGCGAGSSIFDFIMKIEGVEFGDAMRILATKAGVELKKENVQLSTERNRLREICELACQFFEKQLWQSVMGQQARTYLLNRGISEQSIEKWRIGYSPDTWNSLSDFLVSQGYKREEVVKAGLAILKEQMADDSYDRFRGRIMFPVFNLNSQPVGFGGRIFKVKDQKETAKYINTPQTLLYDKSSIIYGLDKAKVAIRKQNQCVVVEGYTDAIMCHQAGFENTVAASGTALTSKHLQILKRYSDNLTLAFDMDLAGDSATKRSINIAQEMGFNVKIVESYGEGKEKSDPADLIFKNPKIWEQVTSKTKSIMNYYIDSAFAMFDNNTSEGKKEIGKIVLPAVKRLDNKIEQSFWIDQLAKKLNVSGEAILEELKKIPPSHNYQLSSISESIDWENFSQISAEDRKKIIEEKITALILKNPEYVNLIPRDDHQFFSEKIRKFLEKIIELISSAAVSGEEDLKENFKNIFNNENFDVELQNFLAALAISAQVHYQEDGKEEFLLCLSQLKNVELKKRLMEISVQIKKAEEIKDIQKTNFLVEEFNKLTKELQ